MSARQRIRELVLRVTPGGIRRRFGMSKVGSWLAGRRQASTTDPTTGQNAVQRWASSKPLIGLTWGVEVSGAAFIDKVARNATFGPDTRVLEMGPGYGRLLQALLARDDLSFASYTGVDLSEANVAHLRQHYTDPRLDFVVTNAATGELPPFDVFYSSLTMKHVHPDFGPVLSGLRAAISDDGRLVFDLFEGSGSFVEHDDVTFVRRYTRAEVVALLEANRFRLVTFDEVHHSDDPRHVRLLVVASPS